MKTTSTKAAFFNSRLLIGFALCSVGLFIGLAGLSRSATGTSGRTDMTAVAKLHHYQLIDLGTFGGPSSYFAGSNGVNDAVNQILNNQGTVAGWADTSTPDPFAPNCFNPFGQDCFLPRAFQ